MTGGGGWDHYERNTRPPPDQSQRLLRDVHGIGPPRRTRARIAVAAAVLVIAAWLVILLSGGGENSSPGSPEAPTPPTLAA